jgi:HEAT repeat protein
LLRAQAAASIAAESVEAFFERWLSISPAARAAAGRAHMAERPREFVAALGEVLAGGSRAQKLRGIDLARRLRAVEQVEGPIIRLSAGDDPHVASAAVAALADGRAPRRVTAARAALGHPDSRVRANAVAALGQIDPDAEDRLGRYCDDPDNRARGNAVLALLRRGRGEAEGALRDMLRDGDALHRVSGVWVARRARVAPAAADLRRVARQDDVAEVRARAAAALRWLEPV